MNNDKSLQSRLGYRFERVELLQQALTHSSYANEHDAKDNERLEFLGDAVLELCTRDLLIRRFPKATEGQLSSLKAMLVDQQNLAQIAKKLALGPLLRLGRGEQRSGGATRPSNMADAVESVLGAVFFDGGIEACRGVVNRLMGPRLLVLALPAEQRQEWKHPKALLQELTQTNGGSAPVYIENSEKTEVRGQETFFCMDAYVDGVVVGSGVGKRKNIAERAAAADALGRLQNSG